MIEKDLKVLVKSCSENRKPIRDGYIIHNTCFSLMSQRCKEGFFSKLSCLAQAMLP